ncbi:outer membrane protein [Variovorax sp. M-6]|uniref:outer membrane protein n=1 Tax=Variovorax sp. M-6 TaxID=3233041 RepID=UPI003F94B802
MSFAAALGCLPAAAQTTQPSVNDWQFEFIPYLWLAGIRSDLKLGPLPGDTLSVSSKGLLEALDAGAMGTFEARKGPWGGLLDVQYVKLGVGNQLAGGLLGGYNVKSEQTIATLAGFYRVAEGPVAVDVLGGVRYVDASTNVDIAPSPRGLGRHIAESASSTNGILGVRATVPLGDRWSLMGYLDVGEGSSTSSWQAIAGASYQYSPTTSLKFGYRYLDYKRDDALLNKVAMGGIYFGAGFKF